MAPRTSLSAAQRALLATRMRASRDVERILAMEPIAIVGMACRFPGADDPESFWKLLCEGRDAVTEPPLERWSRLEDRRVLGRAGYLARVDAFDPAFFGISPREARAMDPQQRLLFEVTWEALERAGLPRSSIAGSPGGVFVGMYNSDYSLLSLLRPEEVHDAHLSVGFSAAANRLSYLLDLHGPSLVVDTACSSALLAVHLACQSLRSCESSVAIAAGVNLILRPELTATYRRWGMLSPDGRCKVFDARADGYVRGEGCGVVVLKRLSDALKDSDPVLALIYGSAVGQDGRTQSVTAPNGKAQEDVLRRALAQAGVSPDDVTYVEAHGTGTAMGDPIEFEAIQNVYGAPRPCLLGAVKANLGHLEAASGMAGLMKAVLALQHEAVPGQLHFESPNPHLGIESTSFRVPRSLTPWTSTTTRYAGVSSFGAGGTNVHVVLAQATPPPRARVDDGRPRLFALSAKDDEALVALTRKAAGSLEGHSASLRDLCHTANAARTHHEHRLGVVVSSREELAARLAKGESDARGRVPISGPPRVVFVFAGQGGQWVGMGRRLLETSRAFRAALVSCDEALRSVGGPSILATFEDDDPATLERMDIVQPALFALQVGLAAAWRAVGVIPDTVVGHSMGEVAAAHLAGALSLEDAAKVIHTRSRLLAQLAGRGAMAVLGLGLGETAELLRGRETSLSVAASNHPTATVISGQPESIDAIVAELTERNVFARRVKVDVASHSPQVDPLLPELRRALAGVRAQAASCEIVSTVTATSARGASFDAEYWAANLRRPVLLSQAIQRLVEDGHELFVEIGPHPLLDDRQGVSLVSSMRRDEDDARVFLEAVSALHVRGVAVDLGALEAEPGPIASLPTYPWKRDRYWLDGLGSPERKTQKAPLVRCALEWERIDPVTEGTLAPSWLIVDASGSAGRAFADAFGVRGARSRVVSALPDEAITEDAVLLVVDGLDDGDGSETTGLLTTFDAFRKLASAPVAARLSVVTRGARRPTSLEGLRQSPIDAFLRSASQEHPELMGTLVDLDPALGLSEQRSELVRALSVHEQHLIVRAGQLFREALKPLADLEPSSATFHARPEGSYLVTGGLGGLGLHVAKWLCERGARRIVLAGRRAPSAEAMHVIAELTLRGASIQIERVDIADPEATEALIRSEPDLCGVIHAAGVLDDALVVRATRSQYLNVLAPKIRGAWNLHTATRDRALDLFVLFSSSASLLGSAGQAHYAAANAFLDGLAHHRRAHGLVGLSVAWGAWAGAGMVSTGERQVNVAAYGISPMDPSEALAALELEMAGGTTQAGVLRIDWSTFEARVDPAPAREPAATENPWLSELRAMTEPARRAKLVEFVRGEVATILGFEGADTVDLQKGLFELGMSSLMAVDLRRRVQRAVGEHIALRSTLVFDYPSVKELAAYIASSIGGANHGSLPVAPLPTPLDATPSVERMTDAELQALLLGDKE